MSDLVQADPNTLLVQASETAEAYLRAGTKAIDDQFGDGYAKEHPELVAAFMQVAAKDFAASMLVAVIERSSSQTASAIESAAHRLGDAVEEAFSRS